METAGAEFRKTPTMCRERFGEETVCQMGRLPATVVHKQDINLGLKACPGSLFPIDRGGLGKGNLTAKGASQEQTFPRRNLEMRTRGWPTHPWQAVRFRGTIMARL